MNTVSTISLIWQVRTEDGSQVADNHTKMPRVAAVQISLDHIIFHLTTGVHQSQKCVHNGNGLHQTC